MEALSGRMDEVREQLEKPLIAGITGFILGLVIGLFMLGWWLMPVEWTDAAPMDLRSDARSDYLRMAIDSYNLTLDAGAARLRWAELGPDAELILGEVKEFPEPQGLPAITTFQVAVSAEDVAAPEDVSEPADEEGDGKANPLLYGGMCLLTILLAGGVVGYFLLRQRRSESGVASPAMQAQEITSQAEQTDFAERGDTPPMSQFMTTYMIGDDLFDDSFSIDSPSGEFLGECGVGISEPIGVGEPKKVTAFEIWLFDKNDIQTVTKVLMSAHAINDEAIRQKLEAKGEPILAEAGNEMFLETATLRLVTRVVDLAYGTGAMPEESFFDRITLELAVWTK